MVQEILINFIAPLFYKVLYMSIIGSIVGIIIYFIRNLFDKKMSGKSKCILWSLVLLTLLVPVRFELKSDYGIMENNFVDRVEEIKYIANYEYSANEATLDNSEFENIESQEPLKQIPDANDKANTYKMPLQVRIKNVIIPSIWLVGLIFILFIFYRAKRKIIKATTNKVYREERLEEILEEAKKQLNIKANVNLVLQKHKRVPSIFGVINPSILITEELLQEENQTIKYIFLHELSHYKRKDLLFNYILLIVLSFHWFNPVIWFLFNKIRQDIEIGADELASKSLTKAQKKEYGMVLINLLRKQTEENYATNLLCMSDTGKNMERRIGMIKRKTKGTVISICVLVVVILLVVGIVFVKTSNTEENLDNSMANITNVENSVINESISEEERQAMTDYINRICNRYAGSLLPEFDNINNIKEEEKYWIYYQLEARTPAIYVEEPYQYEFGFSTKAEIEEDLKNIFGENFNINIEKDLQTDEGMLNIYYNKERDVYEFMPTGWDCSIWHVIDYVKKEGNTYKVKVIEYMEADDFEEKYTDNKYLLIYNSDDYRKAGKLLGVEEIFKIEQSKVGIDTNMSPVINNEVLKRKDEFVSYTITIEKNSDGVFIVKSIER